MPIFDELGNYTRPPEPKNEIIVHQEGNRWWAADPDFEIDRNWLFAYTIKAGETYRYINWTSFVGVALGPVRFRLTSPSESILVTSFSLRRISLIRGTPVAQYVRNGRTLTMLADRLDVDVVEGAEMEGRQLSRLTSLWRESDLDKAFRFAISRSDELDPIDYALMVIFASFGLRSPGY